MDYTDKIIKEITYKENKKQALAEFIFHYEHQPITPEQKLQVENKLDEYHNQILDIRGSGMFMVDELPKNMKIKFRDFKNYNKKIKDKDLEDYLYRCDECDSHKNTLLELEINRDDGYGKDIIHICKNKYKEILEEQLNQL